MHDYDKIYVEWRAALENASLLQGRRKYRRTGAPLPYPGFSVIHDVDADLARKLGLHAAADGLAQRFERVGLAARFAFVSRESFHVTTFDLINKPEYEEKAPKGFRYEDVFAKVRDTAIEWLRKNYLDLRGRGRVVRVGMFPSDGVLKLDLEFDSGTAELFQIFRLEMHKRLCEQCGDAYTLFRASTWNRRLSAHITLAYLIEPLDKEDIEALIAQAQAVNDDFVPIDFSFSRGEAMAFSDMDHYTII